jgi:hypothetical protein
LEVVDALINIISVGFFTLIGGFVLLGFKKLIEKFESKFNIDIDSNLELMLENNIKRGIAYAEELSASKLKSKSEEVIKGNDKLNIAVEFINNIVPKDLLEKYSEDKIKMLINSKIAEMEGVGATGQATIS